MEEVGMAQEFLALMPSGGCLVSEVASLASNIAISASVGQGGRNHIADVRTIQDALNNASPVSGRPMPPLAVDGIVGPKTLAAINAYQRQHLGFSDGRVDPHGPTIRALNGNGGTSPPGQIAGKAPIPPAATDQENRDFIAAIGTSLPTVRQWVHKAQRTLDLAIHANTDGGEPINPDFGLREAGLVEKYYHINPLSRPQRRAYMHELRRVFLDMDVVISQSIIGGGLVGYGCGYFQPDPSDGKPASRKYDAFTFYGGWQVRDRSGRPRMSKQDNYSGPNLREDTVFFPVSHYRTKTQEYINTVIIHELAHFVGPPKNSALRIADPSDRSKPNFLKLDSFTAKRTADVYAYFAAEAALGREPVMFK
jgi:hypothetical protein